MLTTGSDTAPDFTGGAGDDIYIASEEISGVSGAGDNVYASHLNATDVIDGGAGNDIFRITADSAVTLPAMTLSNVETMTIASGNGVTADVSGSKITGLNTVNVTGATTATVTAKTTTDVNISGASGATKALGGQNIVITEDGENSAAIIVSDTNDDNTGTYAAGTITVTDTDVSGANAITVEGGTDVTVTATVSETDGTNADPTGNISIGANEAASGAVSVTYNLENDGESALNAFGMTIGVTGGTTIDVTINATSTAKDEDSDADITINNTNVVGSTDTTEVTVTQNTTTTTSTKAAEAVVKSTQAVTFKALDKDESVTVNGLTFTATKTGGLTAAEVAEAFAGLTASDTQDAGGMVANGYYTNAFTAVAGWTSGVANGATVVFTAPAHNSVAITATSSDAASTPSKASIVAGTAAVAEDTSANAITYGNVTVNDHADATANATITTITLDGYKDATLGAVNSLDALTTISLKDSAAANTTTLHSTSTTLTLNLDNVDATVDLGGTADSVTGLTINANGDSDLTSFDGLGEVTDLTINAAADLAIDTANDLDDTLENVTVTGAGEVNLGVISGTTGLNSFDASANTGGVTATVEGGGTTITGDIEEYIFSGGNDTVKVVDADGENKTDMKITTGAGDDKVTLDSNINTAGAMIDAGAGTDTLHMDAADAVTASSGATFEAKIDGFEKLSLGAASAVGTVDLDNMDDIDYVVSANSVGGPDAEIQTFTVTAGTTAATPEQQTFTVTAATGAGTAVVAGVNIPISGGLTQDEVGALIEGADYSGVATIASVSYAAGTVTIEYTTAAGDAVAVVTDDDNLNTGITFGATADDAQAYDAGGAGDITIEGVAVTLTAGMTIDEVGAAIAAADYSTTTIDTVAYDAATDTVTVTYDAGVDELDTTLADTDTTGVTFGAVATTQDGAAAGNTPALTLDNMADAGTVELTAAGAGVNVTMTDASGSADSLNVVITSEATTNVGRVVVDDVETINVTTNDAFTDANEDGADDADAVHTLAANGDSVETIDIGGAGDITITTTSTVLTTVDATDLTGKLTFVASLDDLTVTGGSAADTLTANADDLTLNGGDGNDIFNVLAGADRVTIDGGAGTNTYNIIGASTSSDTYANITSVSTGDKIFLAHDHNGATTTPDTLPASFVAAEIELSAGATETTQALMDLAINTLGANEMGWFQTGGNTFIIMDVQDVGTAADGNDGFVDGEDMVVMISGLVDLSTASFNLTDGTLEIA